MSVPWVLILIVALWALMILIAFSLARAADKPTPPMPEQREDDGVPRVEWTPGGGWRIR